MILCYFLIRKRRDNVSQGVGFPETVLQHQPICIFSMEVQMPSSQPQVTQIGFSKRFRSKLSLKPTTIEGIVKGHRTFPQGFDPGCNGRWERSTSKKLRNCGRHSCLKTEVSQNNNEQHHIADCLCLYSESNPKIRQISFGITELTENSKAAFH